MSLRILKMRKGRVIAGMVSYDPNIIEIKNNDGELHCEDGPALYSSDLQAWFINNKRHREDGPAVVYFKGGLYKKGSLKWCYYDREYSFKAWCEITEKTEDEIIQLKLKWF